jgi:Tfp pilus assembly protein PilV
MPIRIINPVTESNGSVTGKTEGKSQGMTYRRTHQKGLTLAEAMLAMVILTAASAAMLLPFATGVQAQAEGAKQNLAGMLASDLMEQVLASANPADYNGFPTGFAEEDGQLRDALGNVYTDAAYQDFTRSVSVTTMTYGAPVNGKMHYIDVSVYYQGSATPLVKFSTRKLTH